MFERLRKDLEANARQSTQLSKDRDKYRKQAEAASQVIAEVTQQKTELTQQVRPHAQLNRIAVIPYAWPDDESRL